MREERREEKGEVREEGREEGRGERGKWSGWNIAARGKHRREVTKGGKGRER